MNTTIQPPPIDCEPPAIRNSRVYVPEAESSSHADTVSARTLPPFQDAATLIHAHLPAPPAIIDGLLRRGEKAVLGGASKTFKSWTALDIAFCVSHGIPWLGREVTRGPVLFVNLELPPWCIAQRAEAIAAARDQKPEVDQLLLWNLRGCSAAVSEILQTIRTRMPEGLALIVVDPAYKLLAGSDENSASDIAAFLRNFEELSEATGAAVLVPTHFAKGNASRKESQDRISGSGVWARDPDSIFTLTRHEKQDAFTFEATLRTFPPVAPFVVRWSHPLFTVDQSLDPVRLKRARPGPQPKYSAHEILALLGTEGLTKQEWLERAKSTLGISQSRFYEIINKLEADHKVKWAKGGICRLLSSRQEEEHAS